MSDNHRSRVPGANGASAAQPALDLQQRFCSRANDCRCDSCAFTAVRDPGERANLTVTRERQAADGGLGAVGVRSPIILEEKPICRAAMADLLRVLGLSGPPAFAASLEQALAARGAPCVSIALVDLFSVRFDFQGLRRLAAATGAAVIAIDDRPNPTFARLAREAGARGYACKSFELDQFAAVVRAVTDGFEHFPPEPYAKASPAAGRRSAGLSQRQLDVLKCIAIGMSNQEIARALGITVGTVKLHTHAILRATGTRNRTEVALIAGRFLAPIVEA